MLLNSWLLVVTLPGLHTMVATSFFPVSCWVSLYGWMLFCIAVHVICYSGLCVLWHPPHHRYVSDLFFSSPSCFIPKVSWNQTSPSQPLLEHKCRCLFFQVALRTMGKVLIFLPDDGSQLQVDTEQTDG